VTADDNGGLEARIGAHFGRCPYYTIVEIENGKIAKNYEVENPYFNAHQPGQVPQFIRDQKADVMIAGGMGQRAVQFFNDFGIEAVTGAFGTVKETIEAYLKGTLVGTAPCSGHDDH
jgi:predicted Fe-Mo cluster-binding NifX family protein